MKYETTFGFEKPKGFMYFIKQEKDKVCQFWLLGNPYVQYQVKSKEKILRSLYPRQKYECPERRTDRYIEFLCKAATSKIKANWHERASSFKSPNTGTSEKTQG